MPLEVKLRAAVSQPMLGRSSRRMIIDGEKCDEESYCMGIVPVQVVHDGESCLPK